MKTTNEVTIRGERTNLERSRARIDALLRDGWKRDRQTEERLGRHGGRGPWDYGFACTAKPDRPAAGLWVHAHGPNERYVSNGIPLDKQELNEAESNRVLAEFERAFLRPAVADTGAETEVIQRRPNLEYDLSPEAIRLLWALLSESLDEASGRARRPE